MRGNMNMVSERGSEYRVNKGGIEGGGISSSGFQGENVVVNSNYVSVQTGEEFSSEFIRDRLTPKVVRNNEIEFGFSTDQDHSQMGYEDLARILGLCRVDSECSSVVTEFSSAQGCPPEVDSRSRVDRRCHIDGSPGGQVSGPWDVQSVSNIDQADLGTRVPPIVIPHPPHSLNPCEPGSSDSSQPGKLRILCSFGGRILPRPSDSKLRYVGGETRIISIKKNISWEELVHKTSDICNQPHTIKYQLPGEDLDALISVSSDEDLQNMMEEYGGMERSAGSQRLRIFLIPISETESRTSGSLQQTTPDYEYVVAVNGMVDLSPQKTAGDQLFTDIVKQVGAINRTPSFHGESPSFLHRVESKDSMNFSQASHYSKDVLNPVVSPAESPSFSTKPAQNNNLPTGAVQWHEDSLWQHSGESNSSLNSTQLALDNLYSKPSVQGKEVHFQAHNGGTCLVTPPLGDGDKNHVDGQPSFLEGKPVHHERYMSQVDSRGFMLGSVDSIDSHHGMIHAYSDSQLQQYGEKSPYCSQEGVSPSSPLHFSKRVVSSQALLSPLQDNLIHIVQPEVKNQLVDTEPSAPHISLDMPTPFSSDTLGCNPYLEHFHNATYYTPLTGVDERDNPNYRIQKPHDSDPLGFQKRNISPLHQGTPDQNKIPPNSQFKLLDHNGYHFHPDALVHQEVASSSIDATPASGCIPNSQRVSILDNTSVGLVKNHKHPESQPCVTREITAESLVRPQSAMEQSHVQNQQINLLSGVLCDSFVPMGQQPVVGSKDEVSHGKFLINALDAHPSVVHNATSHVSNHLDNGAAYGENLCLFDNSIDELARSLGKLGDGHRNDVAAAASEIGQAEPINLQNQKQLDPLLFTPHAADFSSKIASDVMDAIADGLERGDVGEGDGIDTETASEDAKSAGEHKDDTVIDAVMAEIEAGLYGLQIIKNADLEELRELGSGTYGTVYHGKWRGSDVAIKRIKKSCFSGRSSEQERLTRDFWREAQILSKLHHPNVVAFYGVVPDGAGGTLATVTEFMVNGSLRNVLLKKDRSLDRRRKLIIAMDAAFGMEYLHSKNIVHFDLKCDNLLVNMRDLQRPICKVGDFGLSRIKRNTLVSGGVRGTLPWMAPELLNGSSNKVSEKVDVFSYGIAMWEILTGEEPYANMHCGAIIGGILKNTLRPPIPERCDPEWRKLMEQCWSVDPDVRPSFTEITNRLRSMSSAIQSRGLNNPKSPV
ncbi:hypothetical protein RND81_05G219300 [Saponaria officinalis]|uniref:Protein kinase domain-containing protein n=1 Tax=Saponaria officinalis TaxID=3572 RepID=A0AAW1KZX4_SAPOF